MLSHELLRRRAEEVFHPFIEDHLGPISVDVTLSPKFAIPKYTRAPLDLDRLPPESEIYDILDVRDGAFTLKPKGFIKAWTIEVISMPPDLVGIFTLRSKMAQAGLEQLTSVFIRPEWTGQLVLELFNPTERPLLLRPGLHVGQINLFKLDSA